MIDPFLGCQNKIWTGIFNVANGVAEFRPAHLDAEKLTSVSLLKRSITEIAPEPKFKSYIVLIMYNYNRASEKKNGHNVRTRWDDIFFYEKEISDR